MGDTGEACAAHLSDQPFEATFHPVNPVLAACTVTGNIEIFAYDSTSTTKVHSLKGHSDSCRTVKFAPDGALLLSGSADKSILATDATSGQVVARLENAHAAGVNTIINLNQTNIASGDDDGTIKVWDTRQRNCIWTFDDIHVDFIADFEFNAATSELIAVSGDGTLSVHNLNKGKLVAASDNQEDELMSAVLVKQGKKCVVGSQGGILNLFTYGDWGDISDRFPGHPESVDSLELRHITQVKVDEDTVFTGSSDGMIRIVSILPNKLLGVVGEHMDCPIERMTLSPDRRFLASASHDNTIKLWDVAYITEEENGTATTASGAAGDQMDGAEESTEAEDMVDSDDEAIKPKNKKKGKKGGGGGGATAGNNFFGDLL